MATKRDDFAWLLELVRGAPRAPQGRDQHAEGYETPEQIYERRTRRQKRYRTLIAYLLQIALMVILAMLFL